MGASLIPSPAGPILDDVDATLDAIDIAMGLLAEVPVLDVLSLIWFVWDIISQVIPFSGKPGYVDTMNVAQNLAKSKNPAAQLWAAEIQRLWTDRGITFSTSTAAAQQAIAHGRTQFKWNIQQQYGFTDQQVDNIATTIEGLNSGTNIPLPHQLDQPAPAGTQMWGPQSVEDDYNQQVQELQSQGDDLATAQKKAWRWILQHEKLGNLWYITTSQKQPTQVIPYKNPPKLPPQPQTTPPPTITPPGPQQQPPTFPSPAGGDELTDCCQAISTALQSLLPYLQGSQLTPGSQPDQCCQQVVAAINAVAATVTDVTAAINSAGGAGSPAVDLSGVITALGNLATVAQSWAPLWMNAVLAINTALGAIAAAIAPGVTNPLAAIASALSKGTPIDGTKNMPLWDLIVKNGMTDPQVGQLADPWPFDQLIAALASLGKYLGGEAGAVESGLGALFINVIEPAAKRIFNLAEDGIDTVLADVQAFVAKVWPMVKPYLIDALNISTEGVEEIPTLVLDATKALVLLNGPITPENSELAGLRVMGWAFLIGQALHLAKEYVGTLKYPISSVLAQNAEMIVNLLGYKAITAEISKALLPSAFGISQKYYYQSQFRPMLPDTGRALEMFARRVISSDQRDTLLGYAGISAAWVQYIQQVAYRPVSPFILAAGFENEDPDVNALTSAAQYLGYRDSDVSLMVQAIQNRSFQPMRSAYVSEAMTAYGAGVVGDTELDQILTDAGFGPTAQALVTKRAALLRRMTLAREVEQSVIPLLASGAIDSATATSQLEAAGIQDWQVNLKVTLAETKATVAAAKKAITAAAKKALQEQRAAIRAAVQQYEAGTLNEATLSAALLAAGLDPLVAASVVLVEEAKRAGRMKLVFGQLLAPQPAKILTDQVNAIEAQLKKALITPAQARQQLAALQVDTPEIDALLARWAASPVATTPPGTLLPIS